MIVTLSTPHGYQQSARASLRTESSESLATQRDIFQDIDLLADQLRRYDGSRGDENRDIAENVRALRDELRDLSHFLYRTPSPPAPRIYEQQISTAVAEVQTMPVVEALPTPVIEAVSMPAPPTPRLPVAQAPPTPIIQVVPVPMPPGPPPAIQQTLSVPIRRQMVDQSVGRPSSRPPSVTMEIIRGDDRELQLHGSPAVSLGRSLSSSSFQSFMSSQHSDDDYLLPEPYPNSPPVWDAPSISDSRDSEESSMFSDTTSSSSPLSALYQDSSESSSRPFPPPSPTPSSSTSVVTVRPQLPTPPDLLGPLTAIREQLNALWDGQTSTNHMLDSLRARQIPPPPDNMELHDKLYRIEEILQTLLSQGPRETHIVHEPAPFVTQEHASRTEHATSPVDQGPSPHGAQEPAPHIIPDPAALLRPSPSFSPASSLTALSDFERLLRTFPRPTSPLAAPIPSRVGWVQQLVDDMLTAADLPHPRIEEPPELQRFTRDSLDHLDRGFRARSPIITIHNLPPRSETEPPRQERPARWVPHRPPRQPLRHREDRYTDAPVQATVSQPQAQPLPPSPPIEHIPAEPDRQPEPERDIDMEREIRTRRDRRRGYPTPPPVLPVEPVFFSFQFITMYD